MKVNYQTTINTNAWRADFSLAEETLMRFYLGDRLMLNLEPVQINKQTEAQCLPKKARLHKKIDGLSISYNVSNLIPFGSEPKIEREFEFTDGFARVIQDINPGKRVAAEKLNIGNMSLPGPWSKIAVVRVPGAGKSFPELEWIELDAKAEKVLFNESYPFLAVILEAPDGKRFEIGCGDDLWRWGIASDLPDCSAEFKISGNEDSIEIVRIPLLFDTESKDAGEVERRTWRFKWYFAWSDAPALEMSSEREQITLDMADFIEEGEKHSCMHSMFSRKQVRQALRGIIANKENADIILTNTEAYICNKKNHLDRSTKKNFLHWDAWDLMELFIWAKRKALATGCTFRIMSPAKRNSETPLMRNFTHSGFQNICGE
ncbi:MAG: hypothetical protein KOO69_03430 [Victivallales bacterium]|nr:hypothetical protein [Victivallales bacterium]